MKTLTKTHISKLVAKSTKDELKYIDVLAKPKTDDELSISSIYVDGLMRFNSDYSYDSSIINFIMDVSNDFEILYNSLIKK